MITLPDIRQDKEWDCGRAALRIICEFYNRPLPLFIANLTNEVVGLAPDTLEAAFRALSFKVISGSWTVDLLKSVTKSGVPVVCLVQMDGIGHWVVVKGVQRNRVYSQCPANGPTSTIIEQWDREWVDYHHSGSTYDRYGIAVYPKE